MAIGLRRLTFTCQGPSLTAAATLATLCSQGRTRLADLATARASPSLR